MLNEQIIPKRRIEQIRAQVAPHREIGKIRESLVPLSHHVKWAVTLQTNLIPSRYARERENQNVALANDLRWFSNRLNYRYFGKASRNKPDLCSLLILPIVEGWKFSPNGARTLHFHVGIGNVPSGTEPIELRKQIRDAWLKTVNARDDIDMRPADSGFIDYIIKELEEGCYEGYDLRGASIPHQALQFCP